MLFTSESHFHGSTHLTSSIPQCLCEVPDFWYWADGDPEWGDWTRPQSGAVMPRRQPNQPGDNRYPCRETSGCDESAMLNDLGDMLEHCETVAGRAFNHAEHYDRWRSGWSVSRKCTALKRGG
jgi:hypothetical protein